MDYFNQFSSTLNNSKTVDYFILCNDLSGLLLIWEVICVFCFILGFPASLMEFWELCQRQRQRKSNDFFMLSMAAIDVSLISLLLPNLLNLNIWKNVAFDSFNSFIYFLALSGRPLFMACVCTDAYVAVIHPITYKTCKKFNTVRIVVSVIVWIISLCTSTWFVVLQLSSIVSCLPLFTALPIILFCDTFTLQALSKPDPSGRSNIHPQKKKALHITINSLIMTCLVYLPPANIFLFQNVMSVLSYYCIAMNAAFCFSIFGCVIMPILYLDSIGKLTTIKNFCKK